MKLINQDEKKLKFYPKSHLYKVGRKKLTSVTKWCKSFFEPFDAKEIARKLAKLPQYKAQKKGVRKILAEWKDAADHGTEVHNAIEEYIGGFIEPPHFEQERSYGKFARAVEFLLEYIEDTDTLVPEYKIYDLDLNLAGTIDLLIYHEDGTVTLVDWKTNKAIKKYKRISPKTKMAKQPFDMFPDCNHSVYGLQLSTYAFMLENKYSDDVKGIREIKIVHLEEDKYTPYEINYDTYKEQLTRILNWDK